VSEIIFLSPSVNSNVTNLSNQKYIPSRYNFFVISILKFTLNLLCLLMPVTSILAKKNETNNYDLDH